MATYSFFDSSEFYIREASSNSGVGIAYFGHRIGVGTETPSVPLEISGTAQATTLTDGSVQINSGAITGATSLQTAGVQIKNAIGDANYVNLSTKAGSSANYTLLLPNAIGTASQILTIIDASTGELGWVSPSAASSPTSIFNGSTNVSIATANGDIDFQAGSPATTKMLINGSDGFVGIGVTATTAFHVGVTSKFDSTLTIDNNIILNSNANLISSDATFGGLELAAGAIFPMLGSSTNTGGVSLGNASRKFLNLVLSGSATIDGTAGATSSTTGALTVAGGAGIAENLHVGNQLTVTGSGITFGGLANLAAGNILYIDELGILSSAAPPPSLAADGTTIVDNSGTLTAQALVNGSTSVTPDGTDVALTIPGDSGTHTIKYTLAKSTTYNSGSGTGLPMLDVEGFGFFHSTIAAGWYQQWDSPAGVALGTAGGSRGTLQLIGSASNQECYIDFIKTGGTDYDWRILYNTDGTAQNFYSGLNLVHNAETYLGVDTTGVHIKNALLPSLKNNALTGTVDIGSSTAQWKDLYLAGTASVGSTAGATSSTTGALTVAGGAGIAENLYVGNQLNVIGTAIFGLTSTISSSGSGMKIETPIGSGTPIQIRPGGLFNGIDVYDYGAQVVGVLTVTGSGITFGGLANLAAGNILYINELGVLSSAAPPASLAADGTTIVDNSGTLTAQGLLNGTSSVTVAAGGDIEITRAGTTVASFNEPSTGKLVANINEVLLAGDFRTNGRGEVAIRAPSATAVAELFFGYGTGDWGGNTNARWVFSDRGTNTPELQIYSLVNGAFTIAAKFNNTAAGQANQFFESCHIRPLATATFDIGSSTLQYKDLYLAGSVYTTNLVSESLEIQSSSTTKFKAGTSVASGNTYTHVQDKSAVGFFFGTNSSANGIIFADETGGEGFGVATTMLEMTKSQGVKLYYNGNKNLETTAAGAGVTGELTVSSTLFVDGTVQLGSSTSSITSTSGSMAFKTPAASNTPITFRPNSGTSGLNVYTYGAGVVGSFSVSGSLITFNGLSGLAAGNILHIDENGVVTAGAAPSGGSSLTADGTTIVDNSGTISAQGLVNGTSSVTVAASGDISFTRAGVATASFFGPNQMRLGAVASASGSIWNSNYDAVQMHIAGAHGGSGSVIHGDHAERCKLLITGMNNEAVTGDVHHIYCEDENGNVDFFIKRTGTAATSSETKCGGDLHVGGTFETTSNATVGGDLFVDGTVQLGSSTSSITSTSGSMAFKTPAASNTPMTFRPNSGTNGFNVYTYGAGVIGTLASTGKCTFPGYTFSTTLAGANRTTASIDASSTNYGNNDGARYIAYIAGESRSPSGYSQQAVFGQYRSGNNTHGASEYAYIGYGGAGDAGPTAAYKFDSLGTMSTSNMVVDNTSYIDDQTSAITGGHNTDPALLIRRGAEDLSTYVYPYTMIECHAVHQDHIDIASNETTAGNLINETNLFGFANIKFRTTQGGTGAVGGSTVAAFPVVNYIASGHGYFNSNDPTNHSKTTRSHDRRRDSNLAFFTSRDNADLESGDDQNAEKDPKLAMLITPDGRIGVGGAKYVNAMIQIQQRHSDANVMTRNRNVPFVSFTASNSDAAADTEIGSIVRSAETGVVYNTVSDYRLKKNISSYSGGLDVINALLPRRFNFITESDDAKKTTGFVAHEVQEVAEGVITGEKDAVYEEDGRPKMQQIDYSKLVPYLVSAVKELSAANQALTARVAALEAAAASN